VLYLSSLEPSGRDALDEKLLEENEDEEDAFREPN